MPKASAAAEELYPSTYFVLWLWNFREPYTSPRHSLWNVYPSSKIGKNKSTGVTWLGHLISPSSTLTIPPLLMMMMTAVYRSVTWLKRANFKYWNRHGCCRCRNFNWLCLRPRPCPCPPTPAAHCVTKLGVKINCVTWSSIHSIYVIFYHPRQYHELNCGGGKWRRENFLIDLLFKWISSAVSFSSHLPSIQTRLSRCLRQQCRHQHQPQTGWRTGDRESAKYMKFIDSFIVVEAQQGTL